MSFYDDDDFERKPSLQEQVKSLDDAYYDLREKIKELDKRVTSLNEQIYAHVKDELEKVGIMIVFVVLMFFWILWARG